MQNLNQTKRPALHFILKYTSEVVVIFLGITISFMFDEWNRNKEKAEREVAYIESLLTDISIKKQELIDDSPSALIWIDRLDSINRNRVSGDIPANQVIWLYHVLTNGDVFFFNSSTPSFNTSYTTGLWQDLPDTVRREVYDLFMVDFEYNRMIYQELKTTISNFRNSYMISTGRLESGTRNELLDAEIKAFRNDLRKQTYENIINEVIIQEKDLHRRNMSTIKRIDIVSGVLKNYLSALTHS